MSPSHPLPPSPQRPLKRARFRERSELILDAVRKYRHWVLLGLLSLAMTNGFELFRPIVIREAVDTLVESQRTGSAQTEGVAVRHILWLAAAFLGITLVQALGRYGWRMYLIRTSMLAGRDLRSRFGRKLFDLSAHFYDKSRVGELMSLATQDVEAVRQAMGPGLLVLADALLYLCTIPVMMFWLSPKLAVIALVPLPLIFWFVSRNEKRIHDRFQRVQGSFSSLSAAASENLGGIRVVKAFAREDAQLGKFTALGREHIEVSLRLARVQAIFGPGLDFFMSLSLVILLFWGGTQSIAGELSLGTFVAFRFYLQQMVWPMTALGFAISHYQRAVASSDRLKKVFNEPLNVPEPLNPRLPADAPADLVARGAWKSAGRVEMKGLRFGFPGTEKLVLDGIDLRIEAGERVAFVGAIGSGKSALLSLLPRIYPVERDMLLIDGVDVNDWPLAELRNQVGYVGQDVFLFSETVTDNVAFAFRPTGPAGDVEFAASSASVHDDVLRLEQGYATRLGERGVNLSGGQKQRLTLARALAKQPSILILDDALSAVDVQTEERILRGLRARAGRNTELIAAHRISTVKEADRIVVLEAGRILQMGTHAELARASGLYRQFYEQQRLKEDLDSYAEGLTK